MKLKALTIVVLFSFILTQTTPAQTVVNGAKDTKEAPYIQRMVARTADKTLYLRFEGALKLGRTPGGIKPGEMKTPYHHAVNQLIVTINNEAAEDLSITVTADGAGKGLKIIPPQVSFKVDDKGAELAIPFAMINFSPIEVNAESYTLYFGNEQMVCTEGRNLFSGPEGRPVRIEIPGLPVKPETPVIHDVKVAEVGPNSVSLEWGVNNRTNTQVTLETAGQPGRVIEEAYRTTRHRLTAADLEPDTPYTAKISGRDFANRLAGVKEISFRTKKNDTAGKQDAWLHVKGKYIVDSAGKPFPLGGYSCYVGEYWWNEFPEYGTPALTARYFRSMGFNVCRLGLVEHKPNHWSASIMNDSSAFQRYGGPAGYVKQFLRPIVDQITNEGIYVIIDWHYTYGEGPDSKGGMSNQDIEKLGRFWEEVAREFCNEPRVAMYQPINEPVFVEGSNRPDLGPRLRAIYKDYIAKIRKHDKRHIIMVSDWNCGWGWATESQWRPVNFDPGDPSRQIVFSKHIAREHLTDAFMNGGVDRVADKYGIPLFFDEVESSGFMNSRETGWLYEFLNRNPRKYGFAIWVIGQYPWHFPREASAFAQTYLPKPPFGGTGEPPIVQWWRLKNPTADTVTLVNTKDKRWVFRYKLPEELPAGDYGLVVESAPAEGMTIQIAAVPSEDRTKLMGTWLGPPGGVEWAPCGVRGNAVQDALYFHAVKPFVEVVIRTDKDIKETDPVKNWTEVQIFRLNPKHQMPAPNVRRLYVELNRPR